ncbi:MAG: 16S rRNA (cytidine(1402)-2'-O)-methyltransferase [Mangrovicoccus sp.]|nr:16S rRNA (cytidine(1402)-2'-O)-methyltransferase [Mangrovicoccus sp.]
MVNHNKIDLAPGLYFIATPIGAARDITLRALDLLASADVLMAEDTRSLRHLMQIHGVPLEGRKIRPYHDHSGAGARDGAVQEVLAGRSVLYAPEAGTPMVSDPGYALGRAVVEAGGDVISAPGPSAMLTALTLSGLPSDRFMFCGFPPQKGGPRQSFLRELAPLPATLIFYEAPKRVRRILGELCEICGPDRQAVLCRELTKRFEETMRGTLAELVEQLGDSDPKGECVLLVAPDQGPKTADPEAVEAALDEALGRLRVKDAAAEVAALFGLPRREVYQQALARQKDTPS